MALGWFWTILGLNVGCISFMDCWYTSIIGCKKKNITNLESPAETGSHSGVCQGWFLWHKIDHIISRRKGKSVKRWACICWTILLEAFLFTISDCRLMTDPFCSFKHQKRAPKRIRPPSRWGARDALCCFDHDCRGLHPHSMPQIASKNHRLRASDLGRTRLDPTLKHPVVVGLDR